MRLCCRARLHLWNNAYRLLDLLSPPFLHPYSPVIFYPLHLRRFALLRALKLSCIASYVHIHTLFAHLFFFFLFFTRRFFHFCFFSPSVGSILALFFVPGSWFSRESLLSCEDLLTHTRTSSLLFLFLFFSGLSGLSGLGLWLYRPDSESASLHIISIIQRLVSASFSPCSFIVSLTSCSCY